MNSRIFLSMFIGILAFLSCKTEKEQNSMIKDISTKATVDYRSVSAYNADSTVNVIIEIPAGTTAKYEMNKNSYALRIDSLNGQPRYINYLGYPGNYGMIPNTILPKNLGGDGDPLDVLLLGETKERGSIQRARPIAILKLLDNGEQDDKVLALPVGTRWDVVKSIEDLDAFYPGVRTIVSTFFEHYKGPGEMELKSWGGAKEAEKILKISAQNFK